MDLIELEAGITPWIPTCWQRELYPKEYRDDFVVLYDGVDTRRCRRSAGGPRTVAGRQIPADVRVITFVADRLEKLRGFDRFVELANRLLRARSDVLCIAVGGSPVRRGLDVQFYNQDFGAYVLSRSAPADPSRFWCLGAVPQTTVAELLAISDLHVYPSRTFAVARSAVEALSSGCIVLAADNEPVREFITHGETGLLVDAADLDAWEREALAVLAQPATYRAVGDAAAVMVREKYAQDVTLPQLAELFDRLLRGQQPSVAQL
jgi:glycosyltransferase involved in cell wall biosynthesis